MTRVKRFKILYAIVMAAGFALGLLLFGKYRDTPLALLVIIVVLLIPGRVQGYFYRDFFSGRRLLDRGRAAEALVCFQRFLVTLRAQPWRRYLLWLQFATYTPSIEAMTLNNIGAAHLARGELDESKRALEAAIAIDPQYPVPFFNLAVLHTTRDEREFAERAAAEAARLGYSGSTMDAVLNRAASLLATVEGKATP